MTKKPTIPIHDQGNTGEFVDTARSLHATSCLAAAYAEMAADRDREAEAEQWLEAASVDAPQDKS